MIKLHYTVQSVYNTMLISYTDNFYQTLTQIRIWALSDNQDVHHLSVCSCGHSYFVIYHPISSKFHIWTYWTTYIKLLFMSKIYMGFVRSRLIKVVAKTDIPFYCRALFGALCRSPTVLASLKFLCKIQRYRNVCATT